MTRGSILMRRLRREQAGTTIIEVLASAVVLAILSLGVLGGIDGAQSQSNQNRLRSVAASLAQADQERLRGLRARQLYNRTETNLKEVRGAQFSVTSTASWLLDQGTEFPCSGKGNYMRISSAVSWPGMGTKPVTVTSLLSPPGQAGTVSATITRANLAGIPGIAVTMAGPENKTVTTDARGCVFFGQLTPGVYTLSFSKPGYIDPNGDNLVSEQITVNAESTVSETYRYDLPGTISATFWTRRGSSAAVVPARPGWIAPSSAFVSVAHSNLPVGTKPYSVPKVTGLSNCTGPTPPDCYPTGHTIPNLFPFQDGYSVFGGDCGLSNPASYQQAPTASPFPMLTSQVVDPGGTHSVAVRLPAVRFRFLTEEDDSDDEDWIGVPGRGGSSATATLTFARLTPVSACGPVSKWNLDDCPGNPIAASCTPYNNNADTGGWIDRPQTTTPVTPVSEDWGVPVGTYDMCVEITNYNPPGDQSTGNYYGTAANVMVKNPDGERVDVGHLRSRTSSNNCS